MVDLATGQVLRTIGNPAWTDYMEFPPDCDDFFAVRRSNVVSVCRASTGELLHTVKGRGTDYPKLTALVHVLCASSVVDCVTSIGGPWTGGRG